MMQFKSLLGFALTTLVLLACSTAEKAEPVPPSSGIVIKGFIIRNQLPYPVTEVMLEIPATGGFAGCGNILANSYCESGFQQADYRANEVVVSWKEWGKPFKTEPFKLTVPADMVAGTLAAIEVLIFSPGQAGAKLVRTAP